MSTTTSQTSSFSIPSIIAIVAAFFSFTTGAVWGLVLALIAIVFGLIGVAVALSPSKRGGIASTLAVIAGAVGIVAAVIKAIAWLF
jgi:hypothetical protein